MIEKLTNNKTRLFWTLQITGWTGYGFLNYLIGVEVSDQPGNYMLPSVFYALGGIVITWCLRWLFRAIWKLKPLSILLVGAVGSLTASVVFTGFRSLVYVQYYERYYWSDLALLDYFNFWDLYISLYVIGTWSALYFSIKYYREVQAQKERLLKATNAAHQAQLKVLRYQLNPHFLFNTLNAISTLTLEGDKETANSLVTKLSAFLRQTLDADPEQKLTLGRELEINEMYLAIEQVRFEDLLTVKYNIEPDARQALVPAMLLQPFIERAIRESVAMAEDGGTIRIAGFSENGKLCLRVADTGPGDRTAGKDIPDDSDPAGLSNTRERLNVLYGEEHELNLEPLESGGLGITICIPFEISNRENSESPDR